MHHEYLASNLRALSEEFNQVLNRWILLADDPETGNGRRGQGSDALPELLTGLLEHVRWLDQLFADWGSTPDHPAVPNKASSAAQASSETWLPFNRKERYFTGTVLPMIVAADGFAHLGRFLTLCGVAAEVKADYLGSQELQFFTEYSFRESVFTDADKLRFPDLPATKDTPDLVLAGPGWLLAVEAKLYQRPNKAALEKQLGAQAELVRYIANRIRAAGTPIEQVRHVALVPESHLLTLSKPDPLRHVDGIITWEQIAAIYQDVGPRFWIGQLQHANATDLTATGTPNGDGFRTGEEIREGIAMMHASGVPYTYMGCSGGLDGKPMQLLLASGGWRTKVFQVRREPYPHGNWFSIAAFQSRLSALGGDREL